MFPYYVHVISTILISFAIAYSGFRKRSLNFSGALSAFIVGLITLHGGLAFACILLFFFYSSSKLTKYRADIKKKREEDYKEGGQRDYLQVLANGAFPSLLCLIYQLSSFDNDLFLFNSKDYKEKTFLLACYLGAYIANASDTWSSEYGITSKTEPIFILTLKRTYHGVNGGISMAGLSASFVCGICYSILCFILMIINQFLYNNEHSSIFTNLISQLPIIILCLFASLFGTLIDSVFGALFEYSGFDKEKQVVVKQPGKNVIDISGLNLLNGNQVNFLAGTLTSILTGVLSLYIC
ncbi:hypothetical protein ABK040_006687 [Willaertia magna]